MNLRRHRIVRGDYVLRDDLSAAIRAGAIAYFFALAVAVIIYLVIGSFAATVSAVVWGSVLTLQGFGAAVTISWRRAIVFVGMSALYAATFAFVLWLLVRSATAAGIHGGYVLNWAS